MNLSHFVQACELRMPVVIALCDVDYYQLVREMERYGSNGFSEWNREKMQFRGRPIVKSEYGRNSYIVEDTPDGPVVHMVG